MVSIILPSKNQSAYGDSRSLAAFCHETSLTSAPIFLPFLAWLKPCVPLLLLRHTRPAQPQGLCTACPSAWALLRLLIKCPLPGWPSRDHPHPTTCNCISPTLFPSLLCFFFFCLVTPPKMFCKYSLPICVVYGLSSLLGCEFHVGRSFCLSLFCLVHCCTPSI